MKPDLATVWTRIRQHEGEEFRLLRGEVFTYEMLDDFLLPVGRVRPLSKANFGKALDRVPLDGYQSVKDLKDPRTSTPSSRIPGFGVTTGRGARPTSPAFDAGSRRVTRDCRARPRSDPPRDLRRRPSCDGPRASAFVACQLRPEWTPFPSARLR
jgi:hypothetical protein